MKITVKKNAVKQLIKEALGGHDWPRVVSEPKVSELPIDANDNLEDEDLTPPLDPPIDDANYEPASKPELVAATSKLSDSIDDDDIGVFYKKVKHLADLSHDDKLQKKSSASTNNETVGLEEIMAIQSRNSKKVMLEEKLRKRIRQLLEISPSSFDTSYSGWETSDDDDDDDDLQRNRKRNLVVTDVDGESLDSIAKSLGFAAPIGAKAFIDRTMEKFKFLWTIRKDDPAQFDKLMLQAMAEYIEYLSSSGELDDDDVRFMKAHPTFVSELDGFRDFLHKYVKRGMRAAK